MEEEKAADYYNELLRKGGNAAKFKQGLGYGTQGTSVFSSAPIPDKENVGSLSSFVKGSSLGKAADLDKEIRIESIRDKLQKREGSSRLECRRSIPRCLEGDGNKSWDKPESKEHARRKTPDNPESEERVRDKSGRRRWSTPFGRTERAVVKKTSDEERKGRSPSPRKGNGRRYSRSSSDDNNSSQSSGRSRKPSGPRKRDGSVSHNDDIRSRYARRSSPIIRNGSLFSRYEGRTWNGNHFRRHRRAVDYKGDYRRGRAYSPHSRREWGRSPPPHRGSSYNHAKNRSTGRSDSSHIGRSGRRRANDRRDERSSGRQSDGKADVSVFCCGSRANEKASERDYSMTPGKQVKAKASLRLSDTDAELHEIVTEDLTMRMSDKWERFDFDKDAPLDDDTKLDYFGDESGTRDDTLFLKNTGSSYLSSTSQVKREALVTAKHETSIFGPREGLSLKTVEPDRKAVGGKKFKDDGESPRHGLRIGRINSSEDRDPKTATPFVNIVLSEQVIAMQQAGSWQDRALKMRKAREVALYH